MLQRQFGCIGGAFFPGTRSRRLKCLPLSAVHCAHPLPITAKVFPQSCSFPAPAFVRRSAPGQARYASDVPLFLLKTGIKKALFSDYFSELLQIVRTAQKSPPKIGIFSFSRSGAALAALLLFCFGYARSCKNGCNGQSFHLLRRRLPVCGGRCTLFLG